MEYHQKEPFTSPQPLDRAASEKSASPRRKYACRHALGDGVASIVIGFFLSLCAVDFLPLMGGALRPGKMLEIAGLVANGMMYFCCGIFYVIASLKIRQPNILWEKALLFTTASHIIMTLGVLILIVFTDDGSVRRMEALELSTACFNFFTIFILAHLFLQALYTRLKCE